MRSQLEVTTDAAKQAMLRRLSHEQLERLRQAEYGECPERD